MKGHIEGMCHYKSSLVFCTTATAGSWRIKGYPFDYAVIDEASQLVEAEAATTHRSESNADSTLEIQINYGVTSKVSAHLP